MASESHKVDRTVLPPPDPPFEGKIDVAFKDLEPNFPVRHGQWRVGGGCVPRQPRGPVDGRRAAKRHSGGITIPPAAPGGGAVTHHHHHHHHHFFSSCRFSNSVSSGMP